MEVNANHKMAKWYIDNVDMLSRDELAEALTYKWFRLNNLYHIKNKDGIKVLFTPNAEQEQFFVEMQSRNVILKARQLGFTTFKMLYDLDDALFIDDFSAGCVCHNLEDAKDIFRNKIKYAYQQITQDQRELLEEIGYSLPVPVNDKDNGYVFSNGSSIKVSVSYRGGTLQSLHISEFGKICKKYPDKAKEIVTGAFEAVGINGSITIESTAEGREGYFYEYSTEAKKIRDMGRKPSALEFAFHFFSWWQREEYELDGPINVSLESYFDQLKVKHGIDLNDRKKAWYSAKWKTLGDDMKREYPSTPEEAFEQSIEGAYYAVQFRSVYREGRITNIAEYKNDGEVHMVCDIGIGDSTAMWFYRIVGEEFHIIHYHENSGEPLGYYIKYAQDLITKNGWTMGKCYGPHDMNNREFASQGKTRRELAAEGVQYGDKTYRMRFEIVPKLGIDDGIQLARDILPRCIFDEEQTQQGVKCLESYRKEWNDKLSCWRDRPLHDWASHGADAFRYFAVTESKRKPVKNIQVRF